MSSPNPSEDRPLAGEEKRSGLNNEAFSFDGVLPTDMREIERKSSRERQ